MHGIVGRGLGRWYDVTGDEPRDILFSEYLACPECGLSFPEIEPRTFSFNSPHGACPECQGLGTTLEFDPELVIPNRDLSLAEGAIKPWSSYRDEEGYYVRLLKTVAQVWEIPWRAPIRNLSQEKVDVLLYGGDDRRHQRSYDTNQNDIYPGCALFAAGCLEDRVDQRRDR